jgi:peptide/nickel transport system permease protein
LTGAFFVEYVFGWNGLGKVTVDALGKLDYPLVVGAVIFSAFIFTVINLFNDFIQKKLNPSI